MKIRLDLVSYVVLPEPEIPARSSLLENAVYAGHPNKLFQLDWFDRATFVQIIIAMIALAVMRWVPEPY